MFSCGLGTKPFTRPRLLHRSLGAACGVKFNNRRSWRGDTGIQPLSFPDLVDPPGTRIHLPFATARLRLICPFPRHKHVPQREHMYQKGHLPAILTSIDSSVSLPHDPREIQGMSRITLVKAAIPISGQSQWRTLVHWHYRQGKAGNQAAAAERTLESLLAGGAKGGTKVRIPRYGQ